MMAGLKIKDLYVFMKSKSYISPRTHVYIDPRVISLNLNLQKLILLRFFWFLLQNI